MIDWLVQPITAHPALARGVAPTGLLCECEQARLTGLKAEKRRRDWLLGRWTAKHLIQSHVERHTGIQVPLSAILVESDADGAPQVILDFGFWILDGDSHPKSKIQNPKLSISHRDDLAFCALSDRADVAIGADIEKVERRDPGFDEDYFTARELEQVRAAPPGERDIITTLIWSAKEAALKALRLGLTVDTRSVSVTLEPPDRFDSGWARLTVICDPRLLGRRVDSMSGWWRVWDACVLTIVGLCQERTEALTYGHGILYPQAPRAPRARFRLREGYRGAA